MNQNFNAKIILPLLFKLFYQSYAYREELELENKYFDKSAPEYETILLPEDFERIESSIEYDKSNDDFDAMYNSDLFEGDINMDLRGSDVELFTYGAIKGANGMYNAVKNRHQLWPQGRIPYTLSSQYSQYRSVIAAAMQEYARYTCVRWVPRANNEPNYIYIFPENGCYSMVGKTGGKQVVSLGSGCIHKGIIMHELMHAVGFFHEQSRADRDNFITIVWQNILPGMDGQFEKYSHGMIDTLGATYDYGSIMHYGAKAFSRNGRPTIIPKRNAEIGQRNGFSRYDSLKINRLYRCQGYQNPTTLDLEHSTTTKSSTTLETTTGSKFETTDECEDKRDDCNRFVSQDWCTQNPKWMQDHCPKSCGMCGLKSGGEEECVDIRSDCSHLARLSYCEKFQAFMNETCRQQCEFCQPGNTSNQQISGTKATVRASTNNYSTLTSSVKNLPLTKLSTTNTPKTHPKKCVDHRKFCSTWKEAGFCQGLFHSYMLNNCPNSCKFC